MGRSSAWPCNSNFVGVLEQICVSTVKTKAEGDVKAEEERE